MAPLSIKKETGLPAISRVTLGSNAVMADGAGGPGLCQSSVAKPRSCGSERLFTLCFARALRNRPVSLLVEDNQTSSDQFVGKLGKEFLAFTG